MQCSGTRVNHRRSGDYCFECSARVSVVDGKCDFHLVPSSSKRAPQTPPTPQRAPEPAVIREARAIVNATPSQSADAHRCYVCGRHAEMRNSLGPTCAEHYDNDGG